MIYIRNPLKVALTGTALVAVFMATTTPANLPAVFMIIPFVVIFIVVASLFFFLSRTFSVQKTEKGRLSYMASGAIVFVMVLGSIGQLTARDFLAVIALFLIAYFYMSRITAPTTVDKGIEKNLVK